MNRSGMKTGEISSTVKSGRSVAIAAGATRSLALSPLASLAVVARCQSWIRPIKPPDVVAMPALRFVRLPAEPGHQPVGEPHVGRVADDGVDLLELGDRVEHLRGRRETWRSCVPAVETMYLSARKFGIRHGWL